MQSIGNQPKGIHRYSSTMLAYPNGRSPDISERIILGNLIIDLAGQDVHVGSERVRLTRLQFELLVLLAGDAGRVVSRERILTTVWGDASEGPNRKLNIQISRLRKRIQGSLPVIETIQSRGYRLRIPTDNGAARRRSAVS